MFEHADDHFDTRHEEAGDRPVRPWRRQWLLGGLAGLLTLGVCLVLILRSNTAMSRWLLRTAGETALEWESYEAALSCFAMAEARGELPIETLFECAKAAMYLGRVSDAEGYLRRLLAREPGHVEANDALCAVLRVAWRNWEIRPHALEMMRQGAFSLANLVALTTPDPATNSGSPAETGLETFILERAGGHPDAAVRLGDARNFMRHNDFDQARPLLEWIIQQRPDLSDAQARLGDVLLTTSSFAALRTWHRQLPPQAAEHPEVWMVRGGWAEAAGERRGAARCYWEVLRRHPDHQVATYRLSRLLATLDRPLEAAKFAARAAELTKVQEGASVAWSVADNVQQLAERLEAMGRLWESLGWSVVTLQRAQGAPVAWAERHVERLRPLINPTAPLVVDAAHLALKIDLSDWPEPVWNDLPEPADVRPTPETAPKSDLPPGIASGAGGRFAFVDAARSAGISFTYFNGADPRLNNAYMFEFSGGGVGVVDYDADGWPDLYLTQGCRWPVDPAQREFRDRLFRNLGNGRFADVTEQAGLRDAGYGQGVSVGDINNDGWPDLYVANIGPNQLYLNNGDGTFSDVTTSSGVKGSEWTISTLIADLNGDGSPDLYDVNYLGGPDVFTKVCLRDGKPIQCFPNQFPAEMDKVYQNLEDGRFDDVSQAAGILAPDGKGMGIVAADLDGSGRLSLFISNDTTPNFLFLNETGSAGGPLRFTEQGVLAGVAYGAAGKTASCMGVAAGDIDGDDRIDLLVTNFEGEANYLFTQPEKLLFEDRIRPAQLYDASFPMEGWGTQFLDADLDGSLDLVVANGHLDDYPHSPGPNRMPVQFFRNVGEGKFAEIGAHQLGPYFENKYLGRAIASLDWNRDGAPDFCVTSVDTPFALLTNETSQRGNFVVVQLRGVQSARDAIGARVTVRSGQQRWSRQLLGGDGYSASNQRHLVFGIGQTAQLDELSVRWPNGREQSFRAPGINRELLVVEGFQELVALPRPSPPPQP